MPTFTRAVVGPLRIVRFALLLEQCAEHQRPGGITQGVCKTIGFLRVSNIALFLEQPP
jgi:hypothetical protein